MPAPPPLALLPQELPTRDIRFSGPSDGGCSGAGTAPLPVMWSQAGLGAWAAADNAALRARMEALHATTSVVVVPRDAAPVPRAPRNQCRPSRAERAERFDALRGAHAFQRHVLGWAPARVAGGEQVYPAAALPDAFAS
eukprot:gene27997-8865_t